MSNARQLIFENLSKRPADINLPPVPANRPQYDWSLEERVLQFTNNLESVHGEVHRISAQDISSSISSLCKTKEIKRLLTSKKVDELLPKAIVDVEQIYYKKPIEDWKNELFNEVDAGITTTIGGIAETGSLILFPDTVEPRLMSLVPPIHIAIINQQDIYTTFNQAIEKQNWTQQMPTNALLVSGPSKTADIEQILVYGAHGPKQLIVLIVENQAG